MKENKLKNVFKIGGLVLQRGVPICLLLAVRIKTISAV